MDKTDLPDIAGLLLPWYDRHARTLPWRVSPRAAKKGAKPDPYRVWLSEVMLQQTTVAAVKSYFEAFTRNWPTVGDLADADREDVMKAWAGLGYYSRARNLHATAQVVANEHDGVFPDTVDALRELPGVGAYTAGAIAAIAFDAPVAVVDGNIERVMARLFAIDTPLPAAKKDIRAYQECLTPVNRPGDYAQALMDLGAGICTPKSPACILCPVAATCIAKSRGEQLGYPVKAPKAERPTRYGAAFIASRPDGAVLLRKRPDKGLLGGMTEVPGTDWGTRIALEDAVRNAPVDGDWHAEAKPVVHVFTHFRLELNVLSCETTSPAPKGMWWAPAADLPGEALPSVMKKAIEAARPGATKKRR